MDIMVAELSLDILNAAGVYDNDQHKTTRENTVRSELYGTQHTSVSIGNAFAALKALDPYKKDDDVFREMDNRRS